MTEYEALMEWVAQRSHRNESGCLVWKLGGAHGGTQPQGRYMGKIILVRRALFELQRGQPLPRDRTIQCSCETEKCVEPLHFVPKPNKSRKGRSNTPAHRAKIAQSQRESPRAKLTIAAVEDIRSKQEPREVYAARYGIAKEYVTDLQGLRAWKDYQNPYMQLLG